MHFNFAYEFLQISYDYKYFFGIFITTEIHNKQGLLGSKKNYTVLKVFVHFVGLSTVPSVLRETITRAVVM